MSVFNITFVNIFFPGLYHLHYAPSLPHSLAVQELSQTASQVQAADCLLRDRYTPCRDHAHTADDVFAAFHRASALV